MLAGDFMTIEQLDSCRVLIVLKAEDMRDFSLEYNTLSFSDAHSRRILSRLLTLACSKTGMDVTNKKMLVEALPHKNGCLILLTLSPKKKRKSYKIKRDRKKLCCIFKDVDGLLDASMALRGKILPRNRAYRLKEKYYLIIDSRPVSLSALGTLTEFCETVSCSPAAAARIEENGRLIADGNAVRKIGEKII